MIAVSIKKDFGVASENKTLLDSGAPEGRTQFRLDVEFVAPLGITILFGASGSGKTSTIKSIAGILRPDAGYINLSGHTLFDSAKGIDEPIRERRLGLVFQNLALFPHMTSLANVEFAARARTRQGRRQSAFDLMERLRIAHTAQRRPRDISGGEAQRVALARALASRPRLLLLDEPLSAIDETTKQEIIADLKMINREMQLPIIYVTHNRDEALSLGDFLVAYDRGRAAATGEPVEILGGPLSVRVARLTGVENIFDGVVVKRDAEAGTMTIEVQEREDSCRLDVPLSKEQEGAPVTVAVRSGDILIATEELRQTSARNILSGHIQKIEERGPHALVRIKSGVTWVVSITPQAIAELKLKPEQKIWLAIKTHSCYLIEKGKGE